MEPGVPFSLLGAAQLLLIAAFAGLAVSAVLRRSVSSAIVAIGAVLLAGVEVRTALQLGVSHSDDLAYLRAAGELLIGVGFLTGGPGSRRTSPGVYGVVVPLAAAGAPASAAAGAAVLTALAALWNRRDGIGLWLAGGFALLGVAAALSATAGSGGAWPVVVLALRGAAALAILAALGLLAQVSLLSKVVGAILVGVLAMAVAAVGVVGNVVASSYDKQSSETVEDAAAGRLNALTSLGEQNQNQVPFMSLVCKDAVFVTCQGYLDQFIKFATGDFVVRITAAGQVTSLAGRPPLTRAEQLGLARNVTVQLVLHGGNQDREDALYGTVRLTGKRPTLAVVAAIGTNRPTANAPPSQVFVYGKRLDNPYVAADPDSGGFGLSFLTGEPLAVSSTNLSDHDAQRVLGIVQNAENHGGIPRDGVTISSQGTNPTLHVVPVVGSDQQSVGLLVLSRDPGPALKTERDALRLLMVTALLALLAVAAAAALLGRRTVDPVRQLTSAAERVAAGDLTATTSVRSRDEVGTLSRTFDAMTSSLGQLTGDLRDSAERLETVLSSMSDGLLATDDEGLVTNVNRAALEMLGLDEVDVLGEHIGIVADVTDASGNQLADPSMRVRDEPGEVHRPDGSTVPVRVEIAPLVGVGGVVLVLRDTTEERKVEKMKTEFLSNVSHELRTPLTPIKGYAEMLVKRPSVGEDTVSQFATVIRDESNKMNRVVDLLVDVATFEAGRVSVTPRAISVKELFDQRLGVWHGRAPRRFKDLKRRVAAGLPPVFVDPVWVSKALDEFIDNAVKYTSTGTAITLIGSLSPDGSRVRVGVKDAGPGISEKDQLALFTSFEQVDGSATRRVGGLGLGLSFVRRLAEDMGFPLTVTTKPGKGAEFALDLPVADQPAPRRTRKQR